MESKSTFRRILPYLLLLLFSGLILFVAFHIPQKTKTKLQTLTDPTPKELLSMLQKESKIASTEIIVHKIGVYESNTEFVSINPATWKLGTRLCVIPVDIKILYGIDLNKMGLDDIQLQKNDTVLIRLPNPEIIDQSFEPVSNHQEVVTLSTGQRKKVGESTMQQVKTMAFNDVVNNNKILKENFADEIIQNTEIVFTSMLKPIGLTPKFVTKNS
ncbi:MAG: DUF4230 domain-containing protein [Bacteroidales bacterium]|nr:DUF4230 domain-containing protein [Bacteroidales bacterium]